MFSYLLCWNLKRQFFQNCNKIEFHFSTDILCHWNRQTLMQDDWYRLEKIENIVKLKLATFVKMCVKYMLQFEQSCLTLENKIGISIMYTPAIYVKSDTDWVGKSWRNSLFDISHAFDLYFTVKLFLFTFLILSCENFSNTK